VRSTTGAGSAEAPLQPRDAATVMVVRDLGDAETPRRGIEVLMLRRNLGSAFAGGAYVFPGGAVDDTDRDPAIWARGRGRSDEEASQHLGIDSGGLAYYVAAVRECFEEAGILLAVTTAGRFLALDGGEAEQRFVEYRRRLNAGTEGLLSICESEGLVLALDRVEYFSHWIPPVGAPRRFDTRFFVAVSPPAQSAVHDEGETIDSMWIEPAAALARHLTGELDLMFPTIKNLEAISKFDRAEALLQAASRASAIPGMLPRVSVEGEGMRILLPGDPGYAEASENAGILESMPLPGRPGGPVHT
jgi:8-oxo-dGTP pyrophosphatase MutT (NUDIX family)